MNFQPTSMGTHGRTRSAPSRSPRSPTFGSYRGGDSLAAQGSVRERSRSIPDADGADLDRQRRDVRPSANRLGAQGRGRAGGTEARGRVMRGYGDRGGDHRLRLVAMSASRSAAPCIAEVRASRSFGGRLLAYRKLCGGAKSGACSRESRSDRPFSNVAGRSTTIPITCFAVSKYSKNSARRSGHHVTRSNR